MFLVTMKTAFDEIKRFFNLISIETECSLFSFAVSTACIRKKKQSNNLMQDKARKECFVYSFESSVNPERLFK